MALAADLRSCLLMATFLALGRPESSPYRRAPSAAVAVPRFAAVFRFSATLRAMIEQLRLADGTLLPLPEPGQRLTLAAAELESDPPAPG